jgi:hypothetical protein
MAGKTANKTKPAAKPTQRTAQKPATMPECLAHMKESSPPARFLIAWDPVNKQFSFGAGTRPYAFLISSSGSTKPVVDGPLVRPKLPREVVGRFGARIPVNAKQLFHDCKTVLRTYVYFADARVYSLVTLWAMGTYLFPIFSHYGYLVLHSVVPRSGKTRAEEVLSHLCFEATAPLNSPTAAALRDIAAAGRTVALDTVERWKGRSNEAYSAAMELLDAGFRNGGMVAKKVEIKGAWETVYIPVFAPYVLAAIDKNSFSETALDRSFVIQMRRKDLSIKKERYSYYKSEAESAPLREGLYVWALQSAPAVAAAYEDHTLEADVTTLRLNDRAADIWKPILAIAKVVDAELLPELRSLAAEMGRDEAAQDELNILVVDALIKRCENKEEIDLQTSDVVDLLQPQGVKMSSHAVHDLLKQWGFSQHMARVEGKPRRAWKLHIAELCQVRAQLELNPSLTEIPDDGETTEANIAEAEFTWKMDKLNGGTFQEGLVGQWAKDAGLSEKAGQQWLTESLEKRTIEQVFEGTYKKRAA